MLLSELQVQVQVQCSLQKNKQKPFVKEPTIFYFILFCIFYVFELIIACSLFFFLCMFILYWITFELSVPFILFYAILFYYFCTCINNKINRH